MVTKYTTGSDGDEYEDADGYYVRASDYDALKMKYDNLAWNLDGCMESINNSSYRIATLEAALGEIIEACDSRVPTWILSRIKAIAIVHLPTDAADDAK